MHPVLFQEPPYEAVGPIWRIVRLEVPQPEAVLELLGLEQAQVGVQSLHAVVVPIEAIIL